MQPHGARSLRFEAGLAGFLALGLTFRAVEAAAVKAWEEDVTLPTYRVGPPDPNPMFYFGRAYQGAEGRVYPYPLYDTLTGLRTNQTYRMVYLENEYLKLGVLPEIGGRIFSAVDKTTGYDFFYRQHVIKPALIGMIGAWISGGVEWNIPHHHRTTSWLPCPHRIEAGPEGSQTVWVGELELRHRTRWAVGLTLYPGRSYVETSVRMLNRTPFVQTVLCFANVAVHATDQYQVIFPPRTRFVTHHAKREFTTWPVATTRYGGGDYRSGIDVSWYRNHFYSSSMFAWNYEDDFFAGYDHGRQAGVLSVADHHLVPGKKLWTWGNGPGGRMWDRILTDDDGPYVELMVGAYSDNQPDYSWMQPHEVKAFKQYWYPFRDIGGVKNATLDAAVNLDVNSNHTARVGFYTTTARRNAVARLQVGSRTVLEETADLSPARAFVRELALPAGTDPQSLRASLVAEGREIVAYTPPPISPGPMPKPVEPPPKPEDLKTTEELYLTGLRIDQFHNPALDPDPYWEEALRRDPGDVRVNTALAILDLRRARFAAAEQRLRKALERLTDRYTMPKDGEAFYYLGVALQAQDRLDEAFDRYHQAAWSSAWQGVACYALAEIACRRGEFNAALGFLDRSLTANAVDTRALNLQRSVLRHLARPREAAAIAAAVRRIDPLDVRGLAETWLADPSRKPGKELVTTFREFPQTALETAVEYGNAGLWVDGMAILTQAVRGARDPSKVSPLLYYTRGYYAEQSGQKAAALEDYRRGAAAPTDFVFPFQAETLAILQRVMAAQPHDARAPYYLGNLLFDWQPEEAVRLWEHSVALDGTLPIVHRNLAVAYSRRDNALDRAIAALEKAVSLTPKYPIHFFELDQLYEAARTPPARRLARLEQNHDLVVQRDDALSREIQLKVFAGQYEAALALMQGRQFNVWEGGARFGVYDSWTDAHLLRGHRHAANGRFQEALADYQASIEYPANLQVARTRRGGRAPEAHYWIGTAYEALGQTNQARQAFEESAAELPQAGQDDVLTTADATVLSYYRALALRKLGAADKATPLFQRLVEAGERGLKQDTSADFFSKFGDQQNARSRRANAFYLVGLGQMGLGEREKARQQFQRALEEAPDHLGAQTALARLP